MVVMSQTLDQNLITELREIIGQDGVLTDDAELMVYECDAITTHKARPLAVVFPPHYGRSLARYSLALQSPHCLQSARRWHGHQFRLHRARLQAGRTFGDD